MAVEFEKLRKIYSLNSKQNLPPHIDRAVSKESRGILRENSNVRLKIRLTSEAVNLIQSSWKLVKEMRLSPSMQYQMGRILDSSEDNSPLQATSRSQHSDLGLFSPIPSERTGKDTLSIPSVPSGRSLSSETSAATDASMKIKIENATPDEITAVSISALNIEPLYQKIFNKNFLERLYQIDITFQLKFRNLTIEEKHAFITELLNGVFALCDKVMLETDDKRFKESLAPMIKRHQEMKITKKQYTALKNAMLFTLWDLTKNLFTNEVEQAWTFAADELSKVISREDLDNSSSRKQVSTPRPKEHHSTRKISKLLLDDEDDHEFNGREQRFDANANASTNADPHRPPAEPDLDQGSRSYDYEAYDISNQNNASEISRYTHTHRHHHTPPLFATKAPLNNAGQPMVPGFDLKNSSKRAETPIHRGSSQGLIKVESKKREHEKKTDKSDTKSNQKPPEAPAQTKKKDQGKKSTRCWPFGKN